MVVSSLTARHQHSFEAYPFGTETEYSYYLCLMYNLAALKNLGKSEVLVIDYASLIGDTAAVIDRVRECFPVKHRQEGGLPELVVDTTLHHHRREPTTEPRAGDPFAERAFGLFADLRSRNLQYVAADEIVAAEKLAALAAPLQWAGKFQPFLFQFKQTLMDLRRAEVRVHEMANDVAEAEERAQRTAIALTEAEARIGPMAASLAKSNESIRRMESSFSWKVAAAFKNIARLGRLRRRPGATTDD
jgi:hypothetical protein